MLKQKGRRMRSTKIEKVIATMGTAVGRQFRLIKPGADGEAVERLLPEQLPRQGGKEEIAIANAAGFVLSLNGRLIRHIAPARRGFRTGAGGTLRRHNFGPMT
ncbi:hypothetical protein QP162_00570 [Sphingomonas aurantiaca]|uniref:hypothetical protein n=1 Tax=Sphingomonas aurantiaca TaxID=185949 RepID=UPI002FE00CCF